MSLLYLPGDTRRKPALPRLDRGDPINRGLQLCLPLSEGGGDAHDLTGRHTTATTGNPWSSSGATHGDFDQASVNMWTLTPTLTVADNLPWTISFWVRFDSTTGTWSYMFWEETANEDIIRMTSSRLVFYSSTDEAEEPALQDLTLNTWHHIVFTCDGAATANMVLYLNGKVEASGGTMADSSLELAHIGTRYTWGAENYDLDNIHIWNRALSPAEVMRLYAEPWAGLVPRRFVPVAAAAAGSTAVPVFMHHYKQLQAA